MMALCAAALTATVAAAASTADPLQVLVATGLVDPRAWSKVETGGAVVAVLPATGRDLSVFGVTRTTASGDRLAARTRAVEELYQGRYIAAINRFSAQPQLADVAGLTLDDEDLHDLRRCRPGDCGLKLSAQEMHDIAAAALAAGSAWKPAVQAAFRRAMVARARAYLDDGLATAAPYADDKAPVSPAVEFDEIARDHRSLPRRLQRTSDHTRRISSRGPARVRPVRPRDRRRSRVRDLQPRAAARRFRVAAVGDDPRAKRPPVGDPVRAVAMSLAPAATSGLPLTVN
jgi:hypothetical protein